MCNKMYQACSLYINHSCQSTIHYNNLTRTEKYVLFTPRNVKLNGWLSKVRRSHLVPSPIMRLVAHSISWWTTWAWFTVINSNDHQLMPVQWCPLSNSTIVETKARPSLSNQSQSLSCWNDLSNFLPFRKDALFSISCSILQSFFSPNDFIKMFAIMSNVEK